MENKSSWFENCAVGYETEKEAESFSKDQQPVGRRTKKKIRTFNHILDFLLRLFGKGVTHSTCRHDAIPRGMPPNTNT